MTEGKAHFVVTFRDGASGDVISLKAEEICDSLLGLTFVAISGFIFDSDSKLVNPTEEALATRYQRVQTLHLSIQHILSIEEIGEEQRGLNLEQDRSKIVLLHGQSELPNAD